MKIMLIKPPLTLPDDWMGFSPIYQPIGLAYMGATLEQNGHEVKILDTSVEKWWKVNNLDKKTKYLGMSVKDIIKSIKNFDPMLVGINLLTIDKTTSFKLIEEIKNETGKKIIVGGPHASAREMECLINKNIDFTCSGEGEYLLPRLLNSMDNGNFDYIDGLGWKEGNRIKRNKPSFIQNLDDLPFPARHLLNMKEYFRAAKWLQGARATYIRHTSVITSRGCPYSCAFCTIGLSMGHVWRPRTPENVILELKQLVNVYDIKYVGFEDDNLTLNPKRMNKICDLIIKEKLNEAFEWTTPNGIRADTLNKDLLIKMKKSGCKRIIVAPESGDQYVVNNIIGKKLDLKKVESVVKACKEIDLDVGCFFVVGMIGETKKQIEKTINFSKKLREYGANCACFIARPFYGTRLYKQAMDGGYLLKHGEDFERGLLNNNAMIKTGEFTPEELYLYQSKIANVRETSKIFETIKTRPLDAFRGFSVHPFHFTSSLAKKYIFR